jgi:RNA polymerase sigma factor (sigma-70 family)
MRGQDGCSGVASSAVGTPRTVVPREDDEDLPTRVTALVPMIRRVVSARVRDPTTADDLVQETLTRVLAAASRIEPAMLEPYAIVTARNVVTSMWRDRDRQQRHQHRMLDLRDEEPADEGLVNQEERAAVTAALTRLPGEDRDALLAHEVEGQDTRSLAADLGSTAGAVAARLNRTRARLRVEYLLALDGIEPPTPRCRAVLLALSSGDRRRQREVDAARHLLECDTCARISPPLLERGQTREDEVRIPVQSDADVVAARQAVRELAAKLGFGGTDLTLIATAVSEVTRNIVKFAGSGEVVVELLGQPRRGVRIVARDTGPGIEDVAKAMEDGYSTYDGFGLGLPGARRLMDEFGVVSEVGRGTTVTMTKWRDEG